MQNRRNLVDRIADIQRGLQMGERIAALHIDLDRFKTINDLSGHEAGDFVLAHCAKLLEASLTGRGFAARVGGDEFLLITQVGPNTLSAAAHAENLVAEIGKPIICEDQHLNVGASIGIAFMAPSPFTDPNTLLSAADFASCEAKKRNSDSIIVHQPQMRARSLQENQLSKELAVALERNKFVPFFQP